MSMQKNKFLRWRKWLVITLLVLAGLVRVWKIEYVPAAVDHDELAHMYDGLSLIDLGIPISWSSFAHTDTQWRKQEIHINAATSLTNEKPIQTFINPWFDHPPFVAEVTGIYLHFLGYHFPDIPPALVYRLPMVFVSVGTLSLIFLLSAELFGFEAGIFSLILAGFSPALIFGQRMVIGENFISFFLLAALYLYIKRHPLVWVFLACVLAAWTKLTGLLVLPIVVADLTLRKQWRTAAIYTAATVLVVGVLYASFGFHFGWAAFTEAIRDQSFRLLGWSNPAFLFASPGFNSKQLLDFSYYVLLFCGFGFFLFHDESGNSRVLKIGMLSSLAMVWVTSAEQDFLGWYKLPLFCLLAVGAGAVWKAKKEWPVAVLLMITVVTNLGLVRFPTHLDRKST